MRIKHLKVSNFRGIKTLEWAPSELAVCLIGPGDSCKSTMLDAIELALSARWTLTFDDNDFFAADVTEPIVIQVTIGELPEEFLSVQKFGLLLRGWTADGEIREEPEDGDQRVLTIQLRVGSDLEPEWTVIATDREPKPISARDRGKLGTTRLGSFVDRHMRWGYGSALLQGGSVAVAASVLADAARAARRTFESTSLPSLDAQAEAISRLSKVFGAAAFTDLKARLDLEAVSVGAGAISLHHGDLPARLLGTGSKRLLAIAVQQAASKGNGLLLVDEVETGLEPHRVRMLLRLLRNGIAESDGAKPLPTQVIFTTHSSVAVTELPAPHLAVVRRDEHGGVFVTPVASTLQAQIRKNPEAFLARRVIVCEGKTELGVTRAFDDRWSEVDGPFALRGVSVAFGNGKEATAVANAFLDLGYQVAFVVDSDDKSIEEDLIILRTRGTTVVQWPDGYSIEERVAIDLPLVALGALLKLASDSHGVSSVRAALVQGGIPAEALASESTEDWVGKVQPEDLRSKFGAAAKTAGWFKRPDRGESLGHLIADHLVSIAATPLGQQVAQLRTWVNA